MSAKPTLPTLTCSAYLCGNLFTPHVNGASNVFCGECRRRKRAARDVDDGPDPSEDEHMGHYSLDDPVFQPERY